MAIKTSHYNFYELSYIGREDNFDWVPLFAEVFIDNYIMVENDD